jgi:hypothetical protein
MLFYDKLAAQVWSLIPMMCVAVFLRTWHRPVVARLAAALLSASAVAALLIAPAWTGKPAG